MAQFDIHRNRSQQKGIAPYLLIVQSARFDSYDRRAVVPLYVPAANPAADPTLNPAFIIEDRLVVMHTLQIAAIPTAQLGEWVGSLEANGDRIIAAIDLLISRAWG